MSFLRYWYPQIIHLIRFSIILWYEYLHLRKPRYNWLVLGIASSVMPCITSSRRILDSRRRRFSSVCKGKQRQHNEIDLLCNLHETNKEIQRKSRNLATWEIFAPFRSRSESIANTLILDCGDLWSL